MSYRYVIFDFDGTLADSLPFLLANLDELAQAHDFRRPALEELERLRDSALPELLQALEVPWFKVPRIARHYRRLMRQQGAHVRPFPRLIEPLRQLKANGVRLGLATSNSEENVHLVLGDDLALFADGEYDIPLLGKARHLAQLWRRSGFPVAALLFVGDEGRDAEAARRVGIPFGAVTWGYATSAALRRQSPALIFERPEDLLQLLAAHMDKDLP